MRLMNTFHFDGVIIKYFMQLKTLLKTFTVNSVYLLYELL